MTLEEWWTLGTIRIVVLLYLVRIQVEFFSEPNLWNRRMARVVWTVAFAFYITHVVSAFLFYHAGSHQLALEHTAATTQKVIGVEWGGGLYFNYLFTALWAGEILAWWILPGSYPDKFKGVFRTCHWVTAFFIFNGTVVFGPRFWTWIFLTVSSIWSWRLFRTKYRKVPSKQVD